MTKYLLILAVTVLGAFAFPNSQLETSDNGRIVGGTDAKPGDFPFIVSLQVGSSLKCGGSILNKRCVITAAHCVRRISPSSLSVVAGHTKLSEGGDRYQASEFIIHPSSDIALIKLNDDIQFSDNVQPIGIEEELNDNNREAVACGWGQTGIFDPISDHLQYVKLIALSNAECRALGTWVNDEDLCTYTKSGEGVCFGDSGGPLVSNGKLIGCVSRGVPCAIEYPDAYARVSAVAQWVKDNSRET